MSTNPFLKSLGTACTGVLICLALLVRPAVALAAASNADCLMCHSARTLHKTAGLKKTSLYVDAQGFGSSSHAKLNCIDCHTDLKNQPLKHKTSVAPVQCAKCHEKTGWNANTIHYAVPGDRNPPNCQTCHGSHYIKSKADAASQISPAHADAICAQCHGKSKAAGTYEHGVHSEIIKNGRPAAGCTDCHEAHTGQPATEPISCAKCHGKEYNDYADSSHGKAFLRGDTSVPTCVTCHGTHDIRRRDDPRSPIHPTNVPATCSKCHDDKNLMHGYGLPTDRLATYRESYHGIANKYGEMKVATCTSCHEAHHSLPSSDPASSTNKQNLRKTCGQCHKGISAKVAQGQAHVVITHRNKNLLYWISTAFKYLTIGTMLALVGHIMLDLSCKIRHACRNRRSDR